MNNNGIEIKIPKNQELMERHYTEKHVLKYVVTRTLTKDIYFLYSVDEEGKLKKLKQAKKPLFKELLK